jgi:hypothetical protein
MNLKTRFNLWKLKREMGPSPAFKASLRKNLSVSWDAKYSNKAPWYQLGIRHAAASFTAIALVLTSAGGVYAYNSPEVTEGTPLYSIKQAIENVEEVTKITPEAKAKFFLKKIERREAEQKVLERKNPLHRIEKEVEDISDVDSNTEINTSSSVDVDLDIKSDDEKEEVKVEVAKRKIKRTQKAIEKTEEELEKTRQIIEKMESKDIKLREELKKRAKHRLEERKKRLEIKVDIQEDKKDRREKLEEEVKKDSESNKVEIEDTAELRTRTRQLINF